MKTINSLGAPSGGTPISAAIRASVNTLKQYAANNKKIILVTDGLEDSGGDYVTEAKKACAVGVNCEVHIIGIGLNDKAKAQAREVSILTSGSFSFIPYTNGNSYNSSTIKSCLSNFYKGVKKATIVASNPLIITNENPIVQTEAKTQPIKDEETNVVAPKPKEEKSIVAGENNTLNQIMDEIRNIKEQLNELKLDKTVIPEIEEDAELNEKIRKASEKYLFEFLKRKHPGRVKWLNEDGESNSDHDFEILGFDFGAIEYYIECKGTIKNKPTFYLTKNEWQLFLNNTKIYQIYFVKNCFGKPSHIFIDNLLDWLLNGKIVPYLKHRDVIKEERVFLTLNETVIDKLNPQELSSFNN